MKPKTKFLKMFYKLPERAKKRLIINPYGNNPMSLNVVCIEVRNETPLGTLCLCELGYIDNAQHEKDEVAE